MAIAAPRKEGRMEARPQPTVLRAAHLALGGRMVAFAGFELPVYYRGIVEERLAGARQTVV